MTCDARLAMPQIEVAADLIAVRELAAFVRQACAEARVEELAAIDLELAVVEAANNIVEHGGEQDGKIGLAFTCAGQEACVVLTDRGRPVSPDLFSRCREVAPDALGGRGIAIMRSCVDEIGYSTSEGINQLRLVKQVSPADRALRA
jgi:serine/threonine-protein kinase RsbW